MSPSHRAAQRKFLELGQALGYRTARSFSPDAPADGVWMTSCPLGVPVVAAEVIVSEGLKARRGSVATLERISPALAVLIYDPDEARRRAYRRGAAEAEAEGAVRRLEDSLRALAAESRQRFQVWALDSLDRIGRPFRVG